VSGFPVDRGWDVESIYDPELDCRARPTCATAGSCNDAAECDPAFFGISPKDMRRAPTPQQRLLLEVFGRHRAGWN